MIKEQHHDSLPLCFLLSLASPRWPPTLPRRSLPAQPSTSYADLVHRLIDLEHPATLPAAGEKCAQWASWDRASSYDAQTGKYVNWAANNDGPQFIREEGDQVVMAEMEGPGCIWRIWSARAEQGHVKIYLDGAAEPAVDLPFVAYFRGDTAPFNYPQLSYDLADHGLPRAEPVLSHPVPEVVQDRGRARLGTLLPLHLHDLPAGHPVADVQSRRWRRSTPNNCSG